MVLALVDTLDGEVESLVNPSVGDDRQLLDWIASVFAGEAWHPKACSWWARSACSAVPAGRLAGAGGWVCPCSTRRRQALHWPTARHWHRRTTPPASWTSGTATRIRGRVPRRRTPSGPCVARPVARRGRGRPGGVDGAGVTPHTLPDRAVVTAALTQARVDPPAPAAVAPAGRAPPAPEGPPEAADAEQVATGGFPPKRPRRRFEARRSIRHPRGAARSGNRSPRCTRSFSPRRAR